MKIFSITKAFKYAIIFIAIPSIILIFTKMLNSILTETLMEFVEWCLNNVDYVIWSKRTNTLLSIISMILVIKIAKRITKLLTQDKNEEE